MSLIKNRAVLWAKQEVTYNTDPVPVTGTNDFLVENLDGPKPANARAYKRSPVRPSFGKLKPIYGGHLAEVSFDVECKGSGTAGTAPEWGAVLKSCGIGETIVGGTSVTYKPISTAIPSLTLYIFRDGKRQIMTGCRVAALKGAVMVGEVMKLSFSFVGHHVSETDVALPTPTYDSPVPVVALSAAVSFDSFSGIFTKIEWDAGIEIARPASINAADGYGEIQITGRDVTGSIDIEDTLVATYDFLTKWKNNTAFVVTTGVIGSVAGNRWQLSFPAVTIQGQDPGDKEGLLTRDIKFNAAESTGDDEFSLVLT